MLLGRNPEFFYFCEFEFIWSRYKNAKEHVRIHTSYIICNDMMYGTWQDVARKVPEFSVMTNSAANNGNPFGAADCAENRNKILATGIDIWEYEGGYSYHDKRF